MDLSSDRESLHAEDTIELADLSSLYFFCSNIDSEIPHRFKLQLSPFLTFCEVLCWRHSHVLLISYSCVGNESTTHVFNV